MHADAVGELHLRQFALAAKLPDFAADELELCWLIHAGFVDFYGIRTINFPTIYGLDGHLSSREGAKNAQKRPPPPRTHQERLPCALYRLGPRHLLGRASAAQSGHPLLVRLYLYVPPPWGAERPLHRFPHRRA